jgi:TolB-like protein
LVAPHAPLDTYRIAVLPFMNLSADAENEHFVDGMTEELISKLQRLRDLKVITRTSVMQYKGTGKGIAEIRRELRVSTILEGSVRKAGERLRITAQLVDVESQGHLWSHPSIFWLSENSLIRLCVRTSMLLPQLWHLGIAAKRMSSPIQPKVSRRESVSIEKWSWVRPREGARALAYYRVPNNM